LFKRMSHTPFGVPGLIIPSGAPESNPHDVERPLRPHWVLNRFGKAGQAYAWHWSFYIFNPRLRLDAEFFASGQSCACAVRSPVSPDFSSPGIDPSVDAANTSVCATPVVNSLFARNRGARSQRAVPALLPACLDRELMRNPGYLNSYAAVYVDGKKAGEMRYPAGEIDLTALCRTGRKHTIGMFVMALPLKGVMLSYNNTASAMLVAAGATVVGNGVLARAEGANVVFSQLAPWQFDYSGEKM